MKSTEILSRTDRTCWSRIGLVLNFFMPRLKTVLPLLALAAVLLALIVIWAGLASSISTLVNYIILVLAIIGPVYIDKFVNNETFISLPANSTEKNIALLIICYIVIPLTVMVPADIIIIMLSDDIIKDAGKSLFSDSDYIIIALKNISAFLFSASLCFMAVELSRSLRVTRGIISGIVSPMIGGIIASVVILVVGWHNGLSSAISSGDTIMISQGMVSAGLSSIKYTSTVLLLLIILFTWLGCRGVSRRQM